MKIEYQLISREVFKNGNRSCKIQLEAFITDKQVIV